jgi:hypothetical protein
MVQGKYSLGHLDTSFGLARVITISNLSDTCTESLRALAFDVFLDKDSETDTTSTSLGLLLRCKGSPFR